MLSDKLNLQDDMRVIEGLCKGIMRIVIFETDLNILIVSNVESINIMQTIQGNQYMAPWVEYPSEDDAIKTIQDSIDFFMITGEITNPIDIFIGEAYGDVPNTFAVIIKERGSLTDEQIKEKNIQFHLNEYK